MLLSYRKLPAFVKIPFKYNSAQNDDAFNWDLYCLSLVQTRLLKITAAESWKVCFSIVISIWTVSLDRRFILGSCNGGEANIRATLDFLKVLRSSYGIARLNLRRCSSVLLRVGSQPIVDLGRLSQWWVTVPRTAYCRVLNSLNRSPVSMPAKGNKQCCYSPP